MEKKYFKFVMHGDVNKMTEDYSNSNPVSKTHGKYWDKTYEIIEEQENRILYCEKDSPETWGYTKNEMIILL
jgi:hypothetical protein